MTQQLYRMGRFAARRPWVVIGTWLVAAVAVISLSGLYGRELTDSFEVPGLDSTQAIEVLSEGNAEGAGLTAQVVVTPIDEQATFFDSSRAAAELAEIQAGLAALPNVLATTDPAGSLDLGAEQAVTSGNISPDGRIALVRLQYPVVEELGLPDLDRLLEFGEQARDDSRLQIEMNGDLFFAFEEPETGVGEMLGIVAAVIILLVAFGSLIAMGLPIGMALFGLGLGISSMSLISYVIEIPSWAPQIASMVGLGVGIDYALFLVTRHREFLARGMTVPEAAGRAVATAGQAVIFAGGTVVIAILGLGVAGVPFMTAAGVATSVVVGIMVVASVTLLPAFLGLSGLWINRLGIHRHGKHDLGKQRIGAGWERWGRHVAGHAWLYTIGVTTLLLALTAPVLALQLGFPDDGSQPETVSKRRAYDLVAEGFGPGINGPLVIAVDLAGDPGEDQLVQSLVEAIGADPGVAGIAPADLDAESGVATIVAFPTTAPQDGETVETITRLRADVLPSILDDTDTKAHVGGQTAVFADIANKVSDRLPLFVTAVIGLSFLLLTLVFRSLLVPLKAAILNLLSIGAAYGVLVAVFQWGWGKELIGLESTVPIVSFIPMFMFAILFGLSMDYEVFLLSRVREEYLKTGDNDRSVIHGIAGTARVITSAALIMISVFAGFVLSDDPTTKMFGLGLATAIFVDASIVRLVLVPASMKLMGDANWWLPGWLDRILPTVDIDGEASLGQFENGGAADSGGAVDSGGDGSNDTAADRDLQPAG